MKLNASLLVNLYRTSSIFTLVNRLCQIQNIDEDCIDSTFMLHYIKKRPCDSVMWNIVQMKTRQFFIKKFMHNVIHKVYLRFEGLLYTTFNKRNTEACEHTFV